MTTGARFARTRVGHTALIPSTVICSLALACSPPSNGSTVATAVAPARITADSTAPTLVAPGCGTLRQDDIGIVLQPAGVRIMAIPLDEPVIRTLAPDSYRTLHSYAEANRQRIAQRASFHGVREPRVWYARYTGLAPDAHFVPTDFTVTSGGRDYRPVDVLPLSSGFGEQRLQPRDTQSGLLIFEEGVDASQPLVVSSGTDRNTDWDFGATGILKKLDNERASIRARGCRI